MWGALAPKLKWSVFATMNSNHKGVRKTMAEYKPRSRSGDVVVQHIDGEILIYDLRIDKAYCLNPTSAAVWQHCDGANTVARIRELVSADLGSKVSDDLIFLALDQFRKTDLVDSAPFPISTIPELSRREIVKRIGAASLVALPILVSLTAPVAVHANSLCMTLVGGCQCGLGDNQPAGNFCTPSGLFSMACADTNCRCLSRGFGPDDCVP